MRFTVRRPASAEVSPCCHRPPGGDVACSVDVRVAPYRAAFTLEHRLALAVSGSDMPAHGASLRRMSGRDLFDPTGSLLPQTRCEQTPSTAAYATVKPPLLRNSQPRLRHSPARTAGHRTHVKGLDADNIETSRDVSSGLFDPVLSTVSLTGRQLCNSQPYAASTPRLALRTSQPLLQHLQPLRLTGSETRCVQQFTRRQCCGYRNPTIDTDHAALTRTRDRIGDVGECNMPAAGAITRNPIGLHTLSDWPRQPEPHPADLRHPYPTEPAVQTLDMMRFQPDLPESLMRTGFAPRGAAVGSAEKVAHRLGEVTQRLLLHRLVPRRKPVVLGARGGQLSTLLVIAGAMAPRLPMLLLLDGQVPYVPRMATMLAQHHRLLTGWKQLISRHIRNIVARTDKPSIGEAAVPSLAKTRDSTPQ